MELGELKTANGTLRSAARTCLFLFSLATLAFVSQDVPAQQGVKVASTEQVTAPSDTAPSDTAPSDTAPSDTAREDGLVRLHPQFEVWVDAKRKRVVVGGEICLREGQLEMFACPQGTKEHESVVAVNAKAYLVHTALLSIGLKSGQPVRYEPVYKSATGDAVQVEMIWRDTEGNAARTPAQQLIRNVKTRQPMKHDWVFAGSGFWEDDETGQKYYQAEGGELICVSNFSTATLDLPVESPRDNADLLYEAWTDRIPPKGTKVRLLLSLLPDSDVSRETSQ